MDADQKSGANPVEDKLDELKKMIEKQGDEVESLTSALK
jgi:hypothetical protein